MIEVIKWMNINVENSLIRHQKEKFQKLMLTFH